MTTKLPTKPPPAVQELDRVTIRFAGDSGDGMQLTGTQFTRTAAVFGNDISTLPDFPAEIRAPAGSLPGVSGFQLSFSSSDIHTPGDQPDVLVAMNPAALKTNVMDLPAGGALIVNSDAFTTANLTKAGYASDPLTDGSLKDYTLFEIPISTLNARALEGLDMTSKQGPVQNFCPGSAWLYERSMDPRCADRGRFSARSCQANHRASEAGRLRRDDRDLPTALPRRAGHWAGPLSQHHRQRATALGLAASQVADRPPSTARIRSFSSDILHQLSGYKRSGSDLQPRTRSRPSGRPSASYGGAMGADRHLRPGVALKSEAMAWL